MLLVASVFIYSIIHFSGFISKDLKCESHSRCLRGCRVSAVSLPLEMLPALANHSTWMFSCVCGKSLTFINFLFSVSDVCCCRISHCDVDSWTTFPPHQNRLGWERFVKCSGVTTETTFKVFILWPESKCEGPWRWTSRLHRVHDFMIMKHRRHGSYKVMTSLSRVGLLNL